MATDATLEKKVKITVLATGFGLKNVPGMDNVMAKHGIEDEEARAQKRGNSRKEGRNVGVSLHA